MDNDTTKFSEIKQGLSLIKQQIAALEQTLNNLENCPKDEKNNSTTAKKADRFVLGEKIILGFVAREPHFVVKEDGIHLEHRTGTDKAKVENNKKDNETFPRIAFEHYD